MSREYKNPYIKDTELYSNFSRINITIEKEELIFSKEFLYANSNSSSTYLTVFFKVVNDTIKVIKMNPPIVYKKKFFSKIDITEHVHNFFVSVLNSPDYDFIKKFNSFYSFKELFDLNNIKKKKKLWGSYCYMKSVDENLHCVYEIFDNPKKILLTQLTFLHNERHYHFQGKNFFIPENVYSKNPNIRLKMLF